MHPEIMLEVARQRQEEGLRAAKNASLAKAVRKAIRAQRTRTEAPDTFVVPPIPDYVDGSFHGAEGHVPAQPAGTAR
jgi:hypothetical protein